MTIDLNDVLGDLGPVIGGIFECMEQAEEEIRRIFPERSDEPEGVFMLAKPRNAIHGAPERLYRAYVRELCERARDGDDDVHRATRAEKLRVLKDVSFVRPLSHGEQQAYERLFCELFPDEAKRVDIYPYPEADYHERDVFDRLEREIDLANFHVGANR